ncbi:methenyltetrahydrofolate cyclohydrolase /5,10-methylenetetrahydrofolate dehydrogenase (NADP+) [Burkholderia sp. GAS332]|nr:methenyltetrahydrofolate cyclohydrolase /5,10-methylenetetrahydrofolate dehydrogenase (NADP+) [Burkholderia sp. GAS332]
MTAQIIDGRALAARLRFGFKSDTKQLSEKGTTPGLAVVLVGEDPASQVYVRNKIRACDECGIASFKHELPETTTQNEILCLIGSLNANPQVHGILVQLPLPRYIDVRSVLEAIAIHKDVDGFHLYNVGALTVGQSIFPPCTPYGVQMLLDSAGISVEGKHAVVVGASNIVGKPMALMLLQREATVTVCHAKTVDLGSHTLVADILVVAAGKPNLIRPEMVKPGAVVIDVGINKLADGSLVGDVAYDAVRAKAAWITPVPGGVGPMTVTMLIANTIRSAQQMHAHRPFQPENPFWEMPAAIA